MVIQILVDAIRKKCPNLALNCWYLDDGVIAGSAKDVREALRILQTLGPELGMDLNLTKNELVKLADKPDEFPEQFKRFHRNFELLGSHIGDADFCTQYITDYTRKRVRHTLEALQDISDPQVFTSWCAVARPCARLCICSAPYRRRGANKLWRTLTRASGPSLPAARGFCLTTTRSSIQPPDRSGWHGLTFGHQGKPMPLSMPWWPS